MSATRQQAAAVDRDHDWDRAQLLELVQSCELAGIARNLCLVRVSLLVDETARRHTIRPHYLRLARAALEPLARADRARLFVLPNHDLVAVWRGEAAEAVAAARATILHLVSDGPDGDIVRPGIWEELALPDQAVRVRRLVEGPAAQPQIRPDDLVPLDTASLAGLEQHLTRVDVARSVRRQAVALRDAKGGFRRAWDRRLLDVEDIVESVLPGVAPRDEPWLFRRLTQSLDRRMLALLASHGELEAAAGFSIALNVTSILAPQFLRFDTALPKLLRGQVILEVQPWDMLADPPAFLFARDFARARGYRLMLAGVTAELLALFPLPASGLDLLGLQWSDDLVRSALDQPALSPETVVLHNADTPEAIAWGVSHGVSLYAGCMVRLAPPGAPAGSAGGR